MKIAMFTTAEIFQTKLTGGQKRFKELYQYLRKRYDVTLYSTDDEQIIGDDQKHVKLKKTKVNKLAFTSTNVLFYKENSHLIKAIKKVGYDRVIVFDVTTAWLLCKAGIKNFDLLLRQDIIDYKRLSLKASGASKIKTHIYLLLMWISESICVRAADRIIVQCKYDGNRLLERHIMSKHQLEEKLSIQINNVNPSWIINNEINQNIKSDRFPYFCLGFVGSIDDYRKGFDLLENYLCNHMRDDTVGALIIGGGKTLDSFKEKYKDNSRVNFLGHISNPMKYLTQCDLVVVPSRADSCPNTVLEPLFVGIPVIGANAGGIPEILNDKEALFDVSSDSLEKAIDILKTDVRKYGEISERQTKRKKELEFNWAYEICKLLNIELDE